MAKNCFGKKGQAAESPWFKVALAGPALFILFKYVLGGAGLATLGFFGSPLFLLTVGLFLVIMFARKR